METEREVSGGRGGQTSQGAALGDRERGDEQEEEQGWWDAERKNTVRVKRREGRTEGRKEGK